MSYIGDFAEDATVNIMPTTHAKTGGAVAPSSAFEIADIRIYKNDSATQKATTNGMTMTSPFDSTTGLHQIKIDTSVDTGDAGFWQPGNDYFVVLIPDETVDGETVVEVLAHFSIENRTVSAQAVADIAVGVMVTAQPSSPPALSFADTVNGMNSGINTLNSKIPDPVYTMGTVNDASPTTTGFGVSGFGLLTDDDVYVDCYLVFTEGSLRGIGRAIESYDAFPGSVTFAADQAWPIAPTDGADFIILGRKE